MKPNQRQLSYINKLEDGIKAFGRNTLAIIEPFKNLQEPSSLSSIDSITQIQRPFQEHANILANQMNNALVQIATAINPNILKVFPALKISFEFASAQPDSISSQKPQLSETSDISAVPNTTPDEPTTLQLIRKLKLQQAISRLVFNTTTTTQTGPASRKRKLPKLTGPSSKEKSSGAVETVKRKRQSLGAPAVGSLSKEEIKKIKKKLNKMEWNAIESYIEIPTSPLTEKQYTITWKDIKLSLNEYKVFKTMKVSKHKHSVEEDDEFFIIKWEKSVETHNNLFGFP